MNAQTYQSPLRNKGDLFLLIKKQNLPKLQQLNQLHKKAKSPNPKNPQIDKNRIKPKSEKYLSTESIPTHSKPLKPGIIRKDSQVSIVQNLNDTSMSEHKKLSPDHQKQYVINISACSHNDSLQQYLSPDNHQDLPLSQPPSTIDFWPQIMEKNQNFKAFFQYILDFKLVKKKSYHPNKPEVSTSKNEQNTKITSKKLPNSLAIKFPEKQAEKKLSKFQQIKSQTHDNKQQRNRELENSQISLVDVRISSASIDDFTPMFNNQSKRLNSLPSSEMKKTKRVYFDFQNPHFSQPDCILEETNPIVQSQNNVTILNRTSSRILSLQELKQRIQNQESQNRIFTHHGYFCDECKADPIVGKRYRCIQCDEYDLCEQCYKKQCEKYGTILRQYENNHKSYQNEGLTKPNMDYFFQAGPLLKKRMSDIVEQENLSQNYSSQENLHQSSEKNTEKTEKDHVHLMQEIQRPKQVHHLNLQKILREANRCSLRSINDKNHKKEGQNCIQKKSLFHPSPLRQKLLNSIKMNKSQLAFSERTIPLGLTQKSHRKILESKRRQIQKIRRSTQSISNLFQ